MVDKRLASGRKVPDDKYFHGMEMVVPWGGGGSSMAWKWEFHGVEVTAIRHLSRRLAAAFATFGGSIREICCPVFAAIWPIWGKIMAKK